MPEVDDAPIGKRELEQEERVEQQVDIRRGNEIRKARRLHHHVAEDSVLFRRMRGEDGRPGRHRPVGRPRRLHVATHALGDESAERREGAARQHRLQRLPVSSVEADEEERRGAARRARARDGRRRARTLRPGRRGHAQRQDDRAGQRGRSETDRERGRRRPGLTPEHPAVDEAEDHAEDEIDGDRRRRVARVAARADDVLEGPRLDGGGRRQVGERQERTDRQAERPADIAIHAPPCDLPSDDGRGREERAERPDRAEHAEQHGREHQPARRAGRARVMVLQEARRKEAQPHRATPEPTPSEHGENEAQRAADGFAGHRHPSTSPSRPRGRY